MSRKSNRRKKKTPWRFPDPKPRAKPVKAPHCPYCRLTAKIFTGAQVYPHRPDLREKKYWKCLFCKDVYVGCHGNTERPLGRLANAELRAAKRRAHEAFDPIWKEGAMRRWQAYLWLSRQLGLELEDCHIGEFDEATCDRVVLLCRAREAPEESALWT